NRAGIAMKPPALRLIVVQLHSERLLQIFRCAAHHQRPARETGPGLIHAQAMLVRKPPQTVKVREISSIFFFELLARERAPFQLCQIQRRLPPHNQRNAQQLRGRSPPRLFRVDWSRTFTARQSNSLGGLSHCFTSLFSSVFPPAFGLSNFFHIREIARPARS